MSDEFGCCWPEQDAVYDWCVKYDVQFTHKEKQELADACTKYRIEEQNKVEALTREVERLRKHSTEQDRRFLTVNEQLKLAQGRTAKQCARAEQAEATVERLREALEKLDEMHNCSRMGDVISAALAQGGTNGRKN